MDMTPSTPVKDHSLRCLVFCPPPMCFAHYTLMHLVTAHGCRSSSTLPLLLLLPLQSSAFSGLPSYLSERFRLSCGGTPQRLAGSRRGHAGSARGWLWSRGLRWLGYVHPPGPDQWSGNPHWPVPPHWLRRHHSAWNLGEGEEGDIEGWGWV